MVLSIRVNIGKLWFICRLFYDDIYDSLGVAKRRLTITDRNTKCLINYVFASCENYTAVGHLINNFYHLQRSPISILIQIQIRVTNTFRKPYLS